MKRTAARDTDEQPTTSGATHDQIAQHAYEIFLARGATHGQDVEDWLHAETALQAAGEAVTKDGWRALHTAAAETKQR